MKPDSTRILLIEDNPGDARLIREFLAEAGTASFEVAWQKDLATGLAYLQENPVDIILLDLTLPDSTGFDTFTKVNEKAQQVPIILLTGLQDEEQATRAVREGAQDYLVKGQVDSNLLVRSIRYAIERKQAKDLLLENAMRYQDIFDGVEDAILVESLSGQILDVNRRACEMYGYTRAQFLTKTVEDLVPSQKNIIAFDQSKSPNLPLHPIETVNLRANGEKFPIELSIRLQKQDGEDVLLIVARDITERKRTEHEISRRLTDLDVLYESSLALTSRFTTAEIGQLVVQILKENLNWHHAIVRLQREESDELEIIGYSSRGDEQGNFANEIARNIKLIGRVGQGLAGWVITHGEGVRSGNVSSDPRYRETFAGMRSGLYTPLITGEKTIGVISIESQTPNAFDEHDEQLIATLAKITANAIQHTRLLEQTEQQLQRLSALHTIDQAISDTFDLKGTFDIILRTAVAQLGAGAALLFVTNPSMNTLEYGADVGFHKNNFKNLHLRLGEGEFGRVVLERRVMSFSNLHKGENTFMHPGWSTSDHFATCHAAPLITKGEIKGVLEIFHQTPASQNPDWLEFFETLADEAAIAISNNQLFDNLLSSNFELAIAYDETIEGWSRAMDLRDEETEGHTQRVTELALRLASGLDFKPDEMTYIRRGSLLHDIGKMGVPDHILRKPGALTDEEWVIMRKHPQFAYEMLLPITYLRQALDIPYCHHEKWDGSGYPRGLKGKAIPLVARIFALADVWDALISDRPYRKAWSKEKALEYLREQSGIHFEPRLVNMFLKLVENV
jgi:PAS domain S-box-containing protein